MLFGDADYCDFIVWTERDMHIERINPYVEFWELALMKAKKFFSLCTLPELVEKRYTPPSPPPTQLHGDDEWVDDVDGDKEEGPWFYCQTDIEGSNLIGCDNPEFAIQWLHMDCLKLDASPKGKLFCPTCWRNE